MSRDPRRYFHTTWTALVRNPDPLNREISSQNHIHRGKPEKVAQVRSDARSAVSTAPNRAISTDLGDLARFGSAYASF